MTDAHQTVEQLVRTRLAEALGGRRGVIESAVPTIIFTICWISTRDLRLSLTLAIGVTVALLVIRIVQRSSVQFVLNALFAIGIAALFAARSGEARDVFLPGILYNAGYAAIFIVSIVIRWPAVGFMIGSLVGDPTGWRKDEALRKVCTTLTWLFAAPCIMRVLVQYPLYASDQVGWLGTSKIVLGWPLQVAAFAAMAWVLSRDKTPLESDIEPI